MAEIDAEISASVPTEALKLLDRKINFDTLTAYIRWKFPHLKPEDRLTRMVIQDINGNRFRRLADMTPWLNAPNQRWKPIASRSHSSLRAEPIL